MGRQISGFAKFVNDSLRAGGGGRLHAHAVDQKVQRSGIECIKFCKIVHGTTGRVIAGGVGVALRPFGASKFPDPVSSALPLFRHASALRDLRQWEIVGQAENISRLILIKKLFFSFAAQAKKIFLFDA